MFSKVMLWVGARWVAQEDGYEAVSRACTLRCGIRVAQMLHYKQVRTLCSLPQEN